jgi:hypothetical protein
MIQRNLETTPAPNLESPAASIPRDTQMSDAEVRLYKDINDGICIAVRMDQFE